MNIRPFAPTDAERINEIYAQHHADSFSVPPLEKSITSGVCVDANDRVVAFGAVTLLAEAILVLDLNAPIRDRKDTITQLLWTAIQGVSGKMDGLHAFVQDPEFVKVLKKHFGFKTCKGEALYLEL